MNGNIFTEIYYAIYVSNFNPYSHSEVGTSICSILQRKWRHREMKQLVQAHTAWEGLRQDLNAGSLALWCLYTQLQCLLPLR